MATQEETSDQLLFGFQHHNRVSDTVVLLAWFACSPSQFSPQVATFLFTKASLSSVENDQQGVAEFHLNSELFSNGAEEFELDVGRCKVSLSYV